ncbi:hypothetical protein HUJ05_000162 [Dendroctonus ponderosae]|nr:hypothetical protein HUJ05_000162 [Dendroctonus ponderosae]
MYVIYQRTVQANVRINNVNFIYMVFMSLLYRVLLYERGQVSSIGGQQFPKPALFQRLSSSYEF